VKALPDSLAGMLAVLERRAPPEHIELGLERVQGVLERLAPALEASRVVTVGGTNGKGSCVAFIEAMAVAAGRSCLAYTSPHVADFTERFRLDRQPMPADAVGQALAEVERARGEVALTWFEHVTLAGLVLAGQRRPDWLLLEVGMGGRLDAVNAVDADLAVITSIGLDHQRWLGSTRAAIAREKCGIARRARPVIVAEKRPPRGMRDCLAGIGAHSLWAGTDFDWRWRGELLYPSVNGHRLPPLRPGLSGRHQGGNATAALVAGTLLLPEVPAERLGAVLGDARLPGRFEYLARAPDIIADVAHNPAAVAALARQLARIPGPKLAVFAALADKDVVGMLRRAGGIFECWYLAGLADVARGRSAAALLERARPAAGAARMEALESVAEALAAARAEAGPEHSIVVFGSFHSVQAAVEALEPQIREHDG